MKHLIETENPSGLATVPYDRIVLDSTENDVIVKGGGYEYVDLGLPSGLKWAKCNIGAEKETDYGDYFQWGSTKANTPDECTWAKAPFNGGASDYDSGYFNSVKDTVCPNDVLAKDYDAAAQIMGGDWRMPTRDEIYELSINTNREWITNYNGSGVNGYKFTSNKEGYQNNSIFIPAAGYREGSSFDGQGIHGEVWSSSVDTSNAWTLYFYGSDDFMPDSESFRYRGHSVRGVFK